MSCQAPRNEYIQSVQNVIEATNAIAGLRAAYISTLRDGLLPEVREAVREWHLCADALGRLIEEQTRMLEAYERAAQHHHS